MFGKIIKILIWIVLGILGLLLLVSVLVYLPPVQTFVKNKASQYVSANLGMELSIDRFRLQFPLRLSVLNATLSTAQGDTIAHFSELSTGVKLLPLFKGQLQAGSLGLKNAVLDYRDTVSALSLHARLGELSISSAAVGLKDKHVDVGRTVLADATVELSLGEGSPKADTVAGAPAMWKILAGEVDLNNVAFRMNTSPVETRLDVNLAEGVVRDVAVDLGKQSVDAAFIRLEKGDYSYLTDTAAVKPPVVDTLSDTAAPPWTIRLTKLEFADNSGAYGLIHGQPLPGLDISHLKVSGLQLEADSLYNRGSEVSVVLRSLSFVERSGLDVTEAHGRFSMDSSEIALAGFELRTPYSKITVRARADASVLKMRPEAELSAAVDATAGSKDLMVLFPSGNALERTIRGQSLVVSGDFSGTLGDININTLTASMPGRISFRANGRVRSVVAPANLSGNVRFNGNFRNAGFLKGLIPDTALRRRIGLPGRLSVDGSLAVSAKNYSPNLVMIADSGRLEVKGSVNLATKRYDATVKATRFPLQSFLPADSLGLLSMDLTAKGRGFDFKAENTQVDISLGIEKFDYRSYDYHDVSLEASLDGHMVEGHLSSKSIALGVDMDISGEISPVKYAVRLNGVVSELNLQRMNFSPSPLSISLLLDASASARTDTTDLRADIVLDSLFFSFDNHTDRIRRSTVSVRSNASEVSARVSSGDMSLDFNSPVSLDSLLEDIGGLTAEIKEQITAKDLDMETVQQFMPPLRLTVSAGKENILHSLLNVRGLGFKSVNVSAATTADEPFSAYVLVNEFRTGGLVLDTLDLGLKRVGPRLEYYVGLANRPGNIEQMARISVSGGAVGASADARFVQFDRSGKSGFDFGLQAHLLDSAVRVEITPLDPLFGYKKWTVNSGNYLLYQFDRKFYSDIRLEGGGQHVYILSDGFGRVPQGAVRVDIAGIDIGEALSLFPSLPPLGGILSTNVKLGFDGDMFSARGEVGVDDLKYAGQKVGDIGAVISFEADSIRRRLLDGELLVDGARVLKASGAITREGEITLDGNVPSLPLSLANAFLPPDMLRMSGQFHAGVRISGSVKHADIDGRMNFTDGILRVPIVGTSYGISTDTIVVSRSKLSFDDFGFISPNRQKLAVNGTVDLSDFARMTADLRLSASDFQAINAPRRDGSQVYGTAGLDMDITAKGLINSLSVRGNIEVLNSTDVTYVLRDSPLQVKDVKQNIVTFVSFADTAALAARDSLAAKIQPWGIDMLVSVGIDEGVQATLDLSEDGNNRIELVGNGSLAYTMNMQGDMRLSGRYDLTGGTVIYNPPVISQKVFKIEPDSYVEWSGEIADPRFNIKATESLKTTVTMDDNTTNAVTFDISVRVFNSLKDLGILFDLAAPNDISIQNQLTSLTQEQRSNQALMLLISNTYNGPGATAKVDANNPLNTFIAKELNQWARNNLQGVDVSFGIDSYDDSALGGGQHTDYSYKVSKSLFSDRVKVTIGGSINTDQNATQNLKENFVDDISLEYRISRRDNMFLKVYRYNTQQSILEGEVIETGAGFLVRKKMNKLRELFRLSRSPEKKAEKKNAMEVRRQLQQSEREAPGDPAREQRQDTPILLQ